MEQIDCKEMQAVKMLCLCCRAWLPRFEQLKTGTKQIRLKLGDRLSDLFALNAGT
jgi:hypothetical protein